MQVASFISLENMDLPQTMSRTSRFELPVNFDHGRAKMMQIVLADGSVVDANAEQNTDLFWALKGGGANFGQSSSASHLCAY